MMVMKPEGNRDYSSQLIYIKAQVMNQQEQGDSNCTVLTLKLLIYFVD